MDIGRNDSCPCGSNLKAKRCCIRHGALFKPRQFIARGDPTSKNSKCYLAGLGGCCTKVSKEHLMSDGILNENKPTLLYDAFSRPLAPYRPLAIEAKVLCKKHNSALGSKFDPVGIALHRAISKANQGIPGRLLLNGHDVENFILQRLAAHHLAGVLTSGAQPIRDYHLDISMIEKSFADGKLPKGGGLYLTPSPAHHRADQFGYETAPLLDFVGRTVLGFRISFGPVGLVVILNALYLIAAPVLAYRPAGIRFIGPHGLNEIHFSWEEGAESPVQSLSRVQFMSPGDPGTMP